MKGITIRGTFIFVFAIFLSLFGSWVVGENQGEVFSTVESGEKLVESACVQCHSLRLVRMVRADESGWRKMVHDMISQGAQVTPDEVPLLINYLSTTFGTHVPLKLGGTESKQLEQTWLDKLPQGAERSIVVNSCGGCHSLQDVVGFQGNYQVWETVVKRMVRLGAPISDPQVSMLARYLARSFGPNKSRSSADIGSVSEGQIQSQSQGQNLVEAACVQCHSLRLVNMVRTDEEGWTKIVYDMISQGAQVTPDEVPLLIKYLARSSRGN